MANIKLGKVTLPPQPKPSSNLEEYVRNVGIWTREVEQTFRQFERALQDVESQFATKTDLDSVVVAGGGTAGPQGPPGRDGVDGLAGAAGAAGATWYTGVGAPSSGTGVNGDNYLNTATGDLYKKVSGSWTTNGNIRGPTGATGSSGTAPFKGASIYASSPGSLTSGPIVTLGSGFSEVFDTDNMVGAGSPGTLPATITVQTTGYYLLQASASIGLSSAGSRGLRLGSSAGTSNEFAETEQSPGTGQTALLHCSNTVYLGALTPVTMWLFQTSGSAQAVARARLTVSLLGT